MNDDDKYYTQKELAQIAATAQHLADRARNMAAMMTYCEHPEWHAQAQQDDLQAVFSELHSVMIGLESESLTEARSEHSDEIQ